MSNKITVLRSQHHREFLAAKRQDPITSKVFAAGDRIALCAVCLLPFLKESWDGMGGAHCGQSVTVGLEAFETAAGVPAAPNSANSDAANTNNRSVGPTAAPPTATALELSPIPIKLREDHIMLR